MEYFVSYYDYYQPEAYIPNSDTYIEKEATINDELDKLRLAATRSLFERRDCIIVASVSCIYGLGSPEAYYGMLLMLEKGQRTSRDQIVKRLVEILYERNDGDFRRGTFRVRGDVVEVFPHLRRLRLSHRAVGRRGREPLADRSAHRPGAPDLRAPAHLSQNPLRHERGDRATGRWRASPKNSPGGTGELEKQGKSIEAQRLFQRTMFDLEMMRNVGYCHGIENYSRHFSGRLPGRSAADAARLPAARRAAVHRRKPPDGSAVARHVPRRPLAQGEPGEVRLSPAERDGQPAADLRGVREPRQPGGLCFRHARPLRIDQVQRRGGGTGHPAHRPDRSGSGGAAHQGPGGQPARRDPPPRRAERARAGHHAHQAHVRGPDRILLGARRALPVSALRGFHARPREDPARRCAAANSTR